MLYQLLIHEHGSGILLFHRTLKNINQSDIQKESFGLFLIGLKTLISEITNQKLDIKAIDIEPLKMEYINLKELKCDILLVFDKKDKKKVSKLTPSLIELLLEHYELFENPNIIAPFSKLKEPINELLIKAKLYNKWHKIEYNK